MIVCTSLRQTVRIVSNNHIRCYLCRVFGSTSTDCRRANEAGKFRTPGTVPSIGSPSLLLHGLFYVSFSLFLKIRFFLICLSCGRGGPIPVTKETTQTSVARPIPPSSRNACEVRVCAPQWISHRNGFFFLRCVFFSSFPFIYHLLFSFLYYLHFFLRVNETSTDLKSSDTPSFLRHLPLDDLDAKSGERVFMFEHNDYLAMLTSKNGGRNLHLSGGVRVWFFRFQMGFVSEKSVKGFERSDPEYDDWEMTTCM